MFLRPFSRSSLVLGSIAGLFVALLVPPDALAAVFGGAGLRGGADRAADIAGLSNADPETFIQNLIDVAKTFLQIAGLVAITVAGFYLILGFGSESAKDRAKNIVIYTAIGLVVVTVADILVDLFRSLGDGAAVESIRTRVLAVLDVALSYLNLAAVIVIVTAGFFLVLGFGSEGAKDRAKKMIIYTVIGLVVIVTAQIIVDLAESLGKGNISSTAVTAVRTKIIEILTTALSFLNLFAVIAVVVAGFYLVLGGGTDESKEKAKKILLYTVIGLLIISFSRVIVGLVGEIIQ